MSEGLTVDGTPIEVAEQAFNEAMAAPEPDEQPAPAPAATDPEAPFGRDAAGTPKAPYGRKDDGTIRRSAGGRRPKKTDRHDQARVQDAASARPAAPSAGKTAAEYRAGIEQFMGTVWAVSAPFAPAHAGAVLVATPPIADSWSALAAHDPRVGRLVGKFTEGSVYAAAASSLLMLGVQIAVNTGRVDHKMVAGLGVRTPEDLAAINAQALQQVAEAKAAQAQAQMAA